MKREKGYLILIGGKEDKNGNMRILRRMLDVRPTNSASIIPTASRYPVKVSRGYIGALSDLGIQDTHVLDIRHRDEADRPEHFEKIAQSDLIFFTGGDQVRLARILGGTRLIAAIQRRLNSGATIAGTSAGAAAASDPMLFDGQRNGLRKGRVHHARGFGFIRGITVDTHFMIRNRLPRLAQFLASGLSRKGVGLSENTALFITPDNTAEVVGDGPVVVLRADRLSHNNYNDIEEDAPLAIQGLKLGFLTEGTRFHLGRWMVTA